MKDFQESINSTIWSPGSHHGSAHSSPLVYFKKKTPSPWNFQGHLSAPDLGLACSNLPCDSRMRARTPTKTSVSGWLAPSCASRPESALRCSPSAWRLEVAPLVRHCKLATQMSAICVISAACKLPCILHININRTAFVGCQLQQGN